MKSFVKILISCLILSPAFGHDTISDDPFMRCFRKKSPDQDIVALYSFDNGRLAGVVVKSEKYVVDPNLKDRGYPFAESEVVEKRNDGVEVIRIAYLDKWSVMVQLHKLKSHDTILNFDGEMTALKCVSLKRH